MSREHSNISIFVPHIGCPNMCSFCNQRHITGTFKAPHTADVIESVRTAARSKNFSPETAEIAFFGGSFTAINRNYMIQLLRTASAFVENGTVRGIRISTRPDAIDEEVLEILKKYRVTAIELGAQSMNNRVLKMNNRGHKASDVADASRLIREFGFELGLQMMTGLYVDNDETTVKTAEKLISLKPDTVRIYPTVVLKDTDLAALYLDGIYNPQGLDDAVALAARLYEMFTEKGIRVIRVGLHSIEAEAYLAGPYHPAFGELVGSRIYLNRLLSRLKEPGRYTVYVAKNAVSKMIGQHRKNIEILKNSGFCCCVKADEQLSEYDIKVKREV